MTILGIDFYSAMIIKNEIGEIECFLDYEKLCSFAGLVPRVHQSAKVKSEEKCKAKLCKRCLARGNEGK
ncbi:MAG: IS110 family transposase [Methanophagales archaeon]|nr:IS110 family transposase [Methanophagales archaeon]